MMSAHSRKEPAIRVNRSISFPAALHAYVAKKAEKEKRSFNWIINDLVQKELGKQR